MNDHRKNMIKGVLRLRKPGSPPFFPRSKVGEFTQGLISPQTQNLLDSNGKGPKGKFKYGRQVCYLTGPYTEWMIKRQLRNSGYTGPIEFPKSGPDGWPICFGEFSEHEDKCLFCAEEELCREKTEGEADIGGTTRAAPTPPVPAGEAATEEMDNLMAQLQSAIDKG